MSEITHNDLRAVAEDIKRDNHASENRLGERIDRLSDHVRALNGKTVTHGEAIADIKPRLRSVEKEIFDRSDTGQRRRATDGGPLAATGPTWQQVGFGVGALVGIGVGAWQGIQGIAAALKWLARGG